MSSKGAGNLFEEAVESGISTVKQTGKGVAGGVSDSVKAASGQVTGNDQSTQDFVKDLYGPSDNKKKQAQVSQPPSDDSTNKPPQAPEEAQKQAEDKQKMQSLRQKLHNEVYYDPLVNYKKNQPEERPAEKVENEKQQEMVDLQEKEKKKPPPLAVQRGMTKTEKFPGGGG